MVSVALLPLCQCKTTNAIIVGSAHDTVSNDESDVEHGAVEAYEMFFKVKVTDNMTEADQIAKNLWIGCNNGDKVSTCSVIERCASELEIDKNKVRLILHGKPLHDSMLVGTVAKNEGVLRVHLTLELFGGAGTPI